MIKQKWRLSMQIYFEELIKNCNHAEFAIEQIEQAKLLKEDKIALEYHINAFINIIAKVARAMFVIKDDSFEARMFKESVQRILEANSFKCLSNRHLRNGFEHYIENTYKNQKNIDQYDIYIDPREIKDNEIFFTKEDKSDIKVYKMHTDIIIKEIRLLYKRLKEKYEVICKLESK